ncbi:antibiotic biosynthesis monooxygenase [Curvibacter sp. APW13]|uniref:antibiotic biosynthesis monooxygenase family protein n=1 Tax=Curvibacter sp. APW13 TaxID=3077236 RepID=UPI0028E05227|nr:antibiotic biosynthesis monooxygenase [Curvibacter sp. APW13]MDT8989971.1 antibiotic biosynthesis monooxygenase [Curvibacter sp. APW13]
MIAVIFEVTPLSGQESRYFDIAATLREQLAPMDGFVSVERFQSLSRPGTYLSLSYWRDEAAVQAWRNHGAHRTGQQEGRATVFADYRIRVAQVLRDYTLRERQQAPADANAALLP